MGRAAPVPIPPNYVYDPGRDTLHDYCSASSDQPTINNKELRKADVDFRGPCARHDLGYDASHPKNVCDDEFKRDLDQQCEYTFGGDTTGFLDYCRGRAVAYYQAVKALGNTGP